jgi:hypothetical protein
MTPITLSRRLFDIHEDVCLGHLAPLRCRAHDVAETIGWVKTTGQRILDVTIAGRSVEGREIVHVRCGEGKRKILLWTQMHGNESTATLALMDIFSFLNGRSALARVFEKILKKVTIHAIPMLNPDGAERIVRHTAVGIDMNRDARRLVTPEGATLRRVHRSVRPEFGFNLHDQELSTVGNSPRLTTIALLAPAADRTRAVTPKRRTAMKLASLIASTVHQFARGHVARYDDEYEPRAFGDRMQSWGTSTVLIESGHWPGDPEKKFVRRLNFVALLTAFAGIADGSYQGERLKTYGSLEPNGKRAFDVILKNLRMSHVSGWTSPLDIGLQVSQGAGPFGWEFATPKEFGDLSGFGSIFTIDCRGAGLAAGTLVVDKPLPLQEICERLHIRIPTKT